MYSNNILSALAAEESTISRDYFESSVYRNILDMLGTLNNIRQELRAEMITIGSMPGEYFNFYLTQKDTSTQRWLFGPGAMANGHAIKVLGKKYGMRSWLELMKTVPNNPWKLEPAPVMSWNPPDDLFPSLDQVQKSLMNSRSQGMDLVNRLRNLEWELNRVHLPMVEDLRKAALLMNDFIRDLPTTIPSHIPGKIPTENDIPYVDVDALDRGRLASYKAAKMLRQMKAWLASMTEKIKARSEFDAAALERIAAEAAARAKAARQAEAEAKAEAERKAAEEEAATEEPAYTTMPVKEPGPEPVARKEQDIVIDDGEHFDREVEKNLRDAGEAKKTAAKAAEVENKIISSDDVPDKGKGGVLLTLAGGAAALFLLS